MESYPKGIFYLEALRSIFSQPTVRFFFSISLSCRALLQGWKVDQKIRGVSHWEVVKPSAIGSFALYLDLRHGVSIAPPSAVGL